MKTVFLFSFFLICSTSTPAYALKDCSSYLIPRSSNLFEVVSNHIEYSEYGNHYIEWDQLYDNTYFNFSASLDFNGVMSVSASLVDYENNKRSSMRGAELFVKSFNFFERENVNGILGHWNQDSDNFAQYQLALASGYSKKQAAFMTWTGKNARALGYDRLIFVKERQKAKTGFRSVEVLFGKEDTDPSIWE